MNNPDKHALAKLIIDTYEKESKEWLNKQLSMWETSYEEVDAKRMLSKVEKSIVEVENELTRQLLKLRSGEYSDDSILYHRKMLSVRETRKYYREVLKENLKRRRRNKNEHVGIHSYKRNG